MPATRGIAEGSPTSQSRSPDCTSPSPSPAPSPATSSSHQTIPSYAPVSHRSTKQTHAATGSISNTTPASPHARLRAPPPSSTSTVETSQRLQDREYPLDPLQTPQ